MRFERLGCFTYSHEENTHAYQFRADGVPEDYKTRARKCDYGTSVTNLLGAQSRKNREYLSMYYRS